MIKRVATAAAVLSTALFTAGAVLAQATPFPRKAITLIVPFPAGGTSDIIARPLAKKVGDALGQSIVVENRPGAAGNIGAAAVARAEKDGHTLMLTAAAVAVAPAMQADPGFKLFETIRPITIAGEIPFMLIVNPSLPVNTPQELWDYLRRNPGKLNFGSGGNGTIVHLAAELLKQQGGFEFTHIPYRGGVQAVQDLIAGNIQFTIDGGPHVVQQVNAGKAKLLAVASSQRLPSMPNVPTISESGMPGFEASAWQGFFVTGGTPDDVVQRLHGEIVKALKSADTTEQLEKLGVRVTATSLQETESFVRREAEKWGAVVKRADIKPD